jgi:hypothetical protein
MGSLKTFPGIVTAVVGRCEATLDQRDLDPKVLAQMFREAQEASRRFATEENVRWNGRVSGTSNRLPSTTTWLSFAIRPFAKFPAPRIECPPARFTTPPKFPAQEFPR